MKSGKQGCDHYNMIAKRKSAAFGAVKSSTNSKPHPKSFGLNTQTFDIGSPHAKVSGFNGTSGSSQRAAVSRY